MESADNGTGTTWAEASRPGAAVRAEGFGVKGPRGWAFRGIDVDAAPGSLVALAGPSGSGRTCLLLALTGRMKAAEGFAEVGGVRLPRKMAAVRRFSALAHVPGVSDLDPAFTVAEHLREAALLRRRFSGSPLALLRPRAGRAAENRRRVEAALEAAGLDPETLPKGERTSVRDLERLEALRLSVALALVGAPRLLAVDDTDLKLGDADEAAAWSMLRSVADSGVTVLAVCTEVPDEADAVVRTTGSAAGAKGDGEGPKDEKAGAEAAASEEAGEPASEEARKAGGTRPEAEEPRRGEGGAGEDDEDEDDEEGAADAIAETGRA
ncbi:ATP-binding cassette domain-containing protein [Streptomyces thermolilacinus]|uniref:ABC transporter ATP-binding protein n=1 Tax=Streptomyces thermolilacinus SPC6 TaxID=1306406 RepID=A0A1D3DWD0_9ACTN|nr:ATP-binding cassette domain-containing protein [Streptomyces thermolilacinus]OEJ96616.1 ABC transporter ATP-binding protein [Streptomyces thermolilacinus SPC6]